MLTDGATLGAAAPATGGAILDPQLLVYFRLPSPYAGQASAVREPARL